jgi:hypothetical protein
VKKKYSTWAFLNVSEDSENKIRDFFINKIGIHNSLVLSNLHLTIYESEKVLKSLTASQSICSHKVDCAATRFMVLKPGGENPDSKLLPAINKVGIRFQNSSNINEEIKNYRSQIIVYENDEILGNRNQSTLKKSAFGARFFQPHVSFLKPQNGITDLRKVADLFRNEIREIEFDRFEIRHNLK